MRSMTGFGSACASFRGHEVSVEARSVNAKFMDLSFRLPPRWDSMESQLAALARSKVARGKIVVTVAWSGPGGTAGLGFTPAAYRAYARSLRLARPGPIPREAVCTVMPANATPPAVSPPAGLIGACGTAVSHAMDQLVAAREAEGRQLFDELASHVGAIDARLTRIETLSPEISADLQTRLEAALGRLGELGEGLAADRDRMAREVALLLVRGDAREELVRLRTHCQTFVERMSGPGPHGKMLEFLLQEMQRELNTLGAKTSLHEVSTVVLEARGLVDQMREQVVNVE